MPNLWVVNFRKHFSQLQQAFYNVTFLMNPSIPLCIVAMQSAALHADPKWIKMIKRQDKMRKGG